MNVEDKLRVTEIQRFCMRDGPGIRTTVFLKGCPLRCAWCHNPEARGYGQELLFDANKCIGCRLCEGECAQDAHSHGEIHRLDRAACTVCGACADACPTGALALCEQEYSVDQLLCEIEKDRAFYGDTGGVTLSGGEPFSQGEHAVDLLRACKRRGLGTAVETCGFADQKTVLDAIPYVDLFLWDVKDTDDERHKAYTGVSNRPILDNLLRVDAEGAVTRLRCILINGVNADEAHYRSIAQLASSLAHCEGVEWIPYHAYGGTKATFLGLADNGKADWIPTSSQIAAAKEALTSAGVKSF